jgi:hypothetical protein
MRTPALLLPLVIALAVLAGCKASSEPSNGDAPATPTRPVAVAEESPAPSEPTATSEPEPTETPEAAEIEVLGDEAFVAWTQQALALIESNAPDAFEEVMASIDVIESVSAGSGMYVEEKRFAVGDQTAHAPGYDEAQQLIWYAGSIVHDAHHSNQYIRGVPETGKDAEIECLMAQLAAMRLITSDPFFPNYLQGLIEGEDDPANQYWNQPDRHW